MNTSLFDITCKLALVTGSSRGLGQELAVRLAGAGARVILHGRDKTALASARERITTITGTETPTVSFDVTDSDAVREGIGALIAEHGAPDVLVNDAGIQRRAPFNEFSTSDWDDIVAAISPAPSRSPNR